MEILKRSKSDTRSRGFTAEIESSAFDLSCRNRGASHIPLFYFYIPFFRFKEPNIIIADASKVEPNR